MSFRFKAGEITNSSSEESLEDSLLLLSSQRPRLLVLNELTPEDVDGFGDNLSLGSMLSQEVLLSGVRDVDVLDNGEESTSENSANETLVQMEINLLIWQIFNCSLPDDSEFLSE